MKLALKSLPNKIEEHNIYRIDLINFNLIQKSLIAFQNDDQDELFNYYDNYNKQRLRKLMRKATEIEADGEEIKEMVETTHSSLTRFSNVLGTGALNFNPHQVASSEK